MVEYLRRNLGLAVEKQTLNTIGAVGNKTLTR